jgi:hypothetical protein
MNVHTAALVAAAAADDRLRLDRPEGKPNPGKARQKAIDRLKHLLANDPDFAGLSMNTEGLHFYVPPPRSYYLAQVAIAVGFLHQPDTLSQSSADIRQSLQAKVNSTDYTVGKNCCNKPLAKWQLDTIERAYRSAGISIDAKRHNSIAKLQRYLIAHRAGQAGGMPFRISGYISEDAVSFVDSRKPGRHSIFTTSTGYPAFKRNGKKYTVGSFEKLL